jgi:hypothetical protein
VVNISTAQRVPGQITLVFFMPQVGKIVKCRVLMRIQLELVPEGLALFLAKHSKPSVLLF